MLEKATQRIDSHSIIYMLFGTVISEITLDENRVVTSRMQLVLLDYT